MICGLCLNFPNYTITWLYEPKSFIRSWDWLGVNSIKIDTATIHDNNSLSPRLPFGVAEYHFPEFCDTRITRTKFKFDTRARSSISRYRKKC